MPLMNFFNPKWKHSDPRIRVAALDQCSDTNIIAEIAIDDPDKDVRLAAIKKIDDISLLEKAINSEENNYTIQYIKRSLDKLYSNKILSSSTLSECELYIHKIDKDEVLVKLVNHINNDEILSLICSKITTESLLAKIVKNSKNKKFSFDLLERISDVDLLKTISKSAMLSSLKKEALKKISKSTGEFDLLQKNISLKVEYEKLCQYATQLSNSTDWEKCENEFSELKYEWARLGQLPDEDYKILEKQFELIYTFFIKKKQNFIKEEDVRDDKMKVLEDICTQIKQNLESDEFQKKKEEVYKLKKKWKREIENISYADEVEQRFSKLINDYDNKYKIMQDQKEQKLISETETLSAFLIEIEGFNQEPRREQREIKEASLLAIKPTCGIKIDSFYPNINRVKEIEKQWQELKTGLIKSNDDLNLKIQKAIKLFFKNLKMEKEVHHWERWENHLLKVALCEKASALEQIDDMHAVAKSLKKLRSEWKSVGDVPREKAHEIWRDFDKTCNNIYKKCQLFYADLNEQKEKNLIFKITLCEQVEALKDSENNTKNADAIKKLQREWKKIGWSPREKEEAIFERFNNGCNSFFEKRKAEYEKIKNVYDLHSKEKEILCEKAEKIIEMNINQAEAFEKELKKEWRQIGDVAKSSHHLLWEKFNAPFIQFHKNILLQAPENLNKKENLFCQLKALLNSISETSDFKELEHSVKEIQNNWSSIGAVPEEKEKNCNLDYSESIDEFYKKQDLFYKEQHKLQIQNMRKKKSLINILESLFESNNEKSTSVEKISDLQSQWDAIGEIPKENVTEIETHYKGLSDSLLTGDRAFFNMMKQEKEKNLKMKLELCVKAEQLVNVRTDDSSNNLDLSSLADELNFAIGSNFVDEKNITPKEKMKKLKDDWQKIGDSHLPKEEKLNKRFNSACDMILPLS